MPPLDPKTTSWEDWIAADLDDRLPAHSTPEGRLYDVLYARQFDKELVEHLCRLATHIRKLRSDAQKSELKKLLMHRYGIFLFQQASSRTRLSFAAACMRMGLNYEVIDDLSTSSFAKGESDEDSGRTFSQYGTSLIVRHRDETFCERIAWDLMRSSRRCRVINAGSGTREHPTQALLDVYTLHRAFEGRMDGRRVALVGDLARGRTVRSLSYLLSLYEDVKIGFIAPASIQMRRDVIEYLEERGVHVEIHERFREGLSALRPDAVYMTRLQKEYAGLERPGRSIEEDLPALLQSGDLDEAERLFQLHRHYHVDRLAAEREWQTLRSEFIFTEEDFDRIAPGGVVLHPLPQDKEKPDIDAGIRDHPQVRIWGQMRNGMWVRAALLTYLYGSDEEALAIPVEGDES